MIYLLFDSQHFLAAVNWPVVVSVRLRIRISAKINKFTSEIYGL